MAHIVGLVGGGAIASPHALAYRDAPEVEELILVEPNEKARASFLERHPFIKKTLDRFDALLAEDRVDLVDLCTPHFLHRPMAIAAMDAGKDVICEKPIATTLEDADAMIEASRRTGRRLFISMNQRMFPAHRMAEKLIKDGVLGDVFLAVVNVFGNEFGRMNDPQSWKGDWQKAGGGALVDTGYHAVYTLQHFCGPATAVAAMTPRLLVEPENKADDNAVVALEFGPHTVGNIVVSYTIFTEPWQETRYLFGTKGSLRVVDSCENALVLSRDGNQESVDLSDYEIANITGHLHGNSVAAAVRYFLTCIDRGEDGEITASDARAALRTVLAAYESYRTGRRVVLGS